MEDVLHFFSHQTHVSLELPVGWEELSEDQHRATYYYEIFDEDEDEAQQALNPRFLVSLFPAGGTEVERLNQASQAMLAEQKQQFSHLSHADVEIDGYPAVTDVFSYFFDELDTQLVQNQTFVLVDDVLFSFTGNAPDEYQEAFLKMNDDALSAARFIFIS